MTHLTFCFLWYGGLLVAIAFAGMGIGINLSTQQAKKTENTKASVVAIVQRWKGSLLICVPLLALLTVSGIFGGAHPVPLFCPIPLPVYCLLGMGLLLTCMLIGFARTERVLCRASRSTRPHGL